MAVRVLRRRRRADGPETVDSFDFPPDSESPPLSRF